MTDPVPPDDAVPPEPVLTAVAPPEPPQVERGPAPEHWWLDPLAAVVAVVALGVLIAALHHPRTGMYVVCVGVGAAAVLRLVLSPTHAGSLVVRRRGLDVAVLLSFSLAIGILAAVTPFPAG